jgi:hypothetical protein
MTFITELIARLLSKTPWFMRNIRNISIVITLITGIPAYLASAGVDLPASLDMIASKIISISGIVSAIIAQLAVPGDTVNTVSDDNPTGK